jgi:hypothetical protein
VTEKGDLQQGQHDHAEGEDVEDRFRRGQVLLAHPGEPGEVGGAR